MLVIQHLKRHGLCQVLVGSFPYDFEGLLLFLFFYWRYRDDTFRKYFLASVSIASMTGI